MAREILVTGGAGYTGAHVAKALAMVGYAPVVIDDLSNGHADAVRRGTFVEADLNDVDALKGVFANHSFAAVIHLAGSIEVGQSMREPLRYFRNNVGGAPRARLDAAAHQYCRDCAYRLGLAPQATRRRRGGALKKS